MVVAADENINRKFALTFTPFGTVIANSAEVVLIAALVTSLIGPTK
ncbi:hypothetical protein Rleg5DRAFT_1862, partial [Rhizobium leguminosarum bv. viciae WSM1455]